MMNPRTEAIASTSEEQVVVTIEHTTTTLPGGIIVFSGKVEKDGRHTQASSSSSPTENFLLGLMTPHTNPEKTTAKLSKMCTVPTTMSPQTACTHTAALLVAIGIIQQTFGVKFSASHARPERGAIGMASGRRIVVVGGETPLGAALTQVLVRVRPEARLVLLSSMTDQRELFQRTGHVIALGAWYAIDGSIPDLMDYAGLQEEDGVEIIFNAANGVDVREDLSRTGRVVQCRGRESMLEGFDMEDEQLSKVVYSMLEEAAKEMAKWVEPPDSCGFEGDNDE